MIFEMWGSVKYKYCNRQFWCRGYYVDTVGKDTAKIKEYISNQLHEDKINSQLSIEDAIDPFTGCELKKRRRQIFC